MVRAPVAAAALAATMAVAHAQEKNFSLELNNANDVNGGCRLTYIAVNKTGTPLERTSYEVVVFDGDQKVSRFLVLEFGKLPVGKTKVVQFDLADQPCAGISRLLINDVAECTGSGGDSAVCMDNLATNTRTEIGFGL